MSRKSNRKSSNSMPDSDELNRELKYNPLTGKLYWRIPKRNRKMGLRAGGVKGRYRYITIGGVNYLEHRVIWVMVHGSIPDGQEIDHINRDGGDNRLENLRLVTRRGNVLNRGVAGSDCSKYPGVTTSKTPGKYTAGFYISSNRVHLGTYTTEEEAYNVYCQAVIEYNKLKLVNDGRIRSTLDIGGLIYKVIYEQDRNKWLYKVVRYKGNEVVGASTERYGYKSASEVQAAGNKWLLAKELNHIMKKKKLKKS